MGSRRTTAGGMLRAGEILRVLAEKLPDGLLQAYIQDQPPQQVRNILLEAVAVLAPPKRVKSGPSPQAKLWQDKGKDWKGKIKGKVLQLYTDGASRGNPGEAGAGIAIYDDKGNELVAVGEYLGQCTNNEAEYKALLLGIARCSDFGRGRLKIHMDSELIVKQILGEYRVKHPNLVPLFQQTMQSLGEFAFYSIIHVRREKNSRADELANRAIDNHLS